MDSLRQNHAREIASEWLCQHAFGEPGIAGALSGAGFTEEETRLAESQIISRAAYPASGLKTTS